MKTLSYLFTLFFVFNALAAAPYGIKGQSQSGTLYSNVHQFPNNQVTNMGGINALVETGNKNILVNPSFEHLTFSTGWTNSAGTFTEETALKIDGLKAAKLVLSAQTMSLTQSSTLYASQFADGVQGLAMVRVKSDVALKVCAIQAGVVSTTLCVDVLAHNKWGLFKVPFILGATSNGISIASTGNVTGTVYIDDAFVGAVDLQASVDQSRIAGESFFAGTTSCTWSRTNTAIGAFTATAACPGPTIVDGSMGSWQTTDSDLPRQTVNNLPAGKYKANFLFAISANTSTAVSFAINDGSTTCTQQGGGANNTFAGYVVVSCYFNYTSSGNRVFELHGSAIATATAIIQNDTTAGSVRNTKFQLEYFGLGSIYSSTNADTDWASCGHTTSDFAGFGTVSAIETQCKREGSDLLMRGRFTAGTTTAVEARVGLKLGGLTLTSANSTKIPAIQSANGVLYSSVTASNVGYLIEPSVTYATITTAGSFTKASGTAFTAGNILGVNARVPINGFDNSNVIIGSFNEVVTTPGVSKPVTYSARVSAIGVVSNEIGNFINGNCTMTNPTNTCPFVSSTFSSAPNCTVVLDDNTLGTLMAKINNLSTSSTQIGYVTQIAGSNTYQAEEVNIICHGVSP